MVIAWGSTETSPLATDCHFQAQRSGNIGVPIPGTEFKLLPSGDKLEVRVRGPERHARLLEGARTDCAGLRRRRLLSDRRRCDALPIPPAPKLGLVFDGRVAEDFKLNSGTWVSVGTVRITGIAALAPVAQDIVVTGHGGDEVRFLVFPNMPACRAHGRPARQRRCERGDWPRQGAQRDRVRPCKAEGAERRLSDHATRALLMAEPPSVDGGEITDKGYINQRAVLTRRARRWRSLDDDAASAEWIGC